jgi:hypothetical protein
MTERERLLAVYRGETPDRVPFFLDLSHWFYQRERIPFDLSVALTEPDWPLLECHRQHGAGFYMPNLISYWTASYPSDVVASVTKHQTPHGPEIAWRIETPIGAIERRRVWQEVSYSWNISRWGVETAADVRVLGYALSRLEFAPAWDRYLDWVRAAGDLGVPYMGLGYSAMGQLLNYWMGVERTCFAAADMPEVLDEYVEAVNANLLRAVDLLCASPAEIIVTGDNFSSDLQPPRFFRKWSDAFYREAFARIRRAGKFSAVHVDGRMRGLLREFAALGVDCIDAVTPAPMGDLTPEQCRDEAGPDLILSGGVSPTVWLPEVDEAEFRRSVRDWLDLRRRSPRLIAAAGDQVPPGAVESRIDIMREMVEEHGRYG